MTPNQFNQVLAAIPNLHLRRYKVEDVQMLFKIAYWCALRINEAIRLNAEDFNLEESEVYLGKTKTEKIDHATIPRLFVPELATYLLGKQGPLFPRLQYIVVYVWITRLGKMLDVKAWTTPQSQTGEKTKSHIFRKSMAKDMMYGTYTPGRKAPLNIISKQLRHKGRNAIVMTERYLRVDDQTVKDWWLEQEIKEPVEV